MRKVPLLEKLNYRLWSWLTRPPWRERRRRLQPGTRVWVNAQFGDGEELWFYDGLPGEIVRYVEEFNGDYYELVLEGAPHPRVTAHIESLLLSDPLRQHRCVDPQTGEIGTSRIELGRRCVGWVDDVPGGTPINDRLERVEAPGEPVAWTITFGHAPKHPASYASFHAALNHWNSTHAPR
jgi:hypothetical protein